MKIFYSIFIISLFLFSCNTENKSRIKVELNSGWKFKSTNDSIELKAEVPGVIHLDLFNNNIIPDPFDSTNEQQLQWIGEQNWEYRCTFDMYNKDIYKNTDLVFDGLDTYAEIYLNGSLILSADNMYRQWRIDIKSILKLEDNNLRIVFDAPEKVIDSLAAQLQYILPQKRGFARKAPYHFGWDWGAKFLSSGIWKRVYLDSWNNAKINNVHILQKEIDSLNANFTANLDLSSDVNGEFSIEIINSEILEIYSKQTLELTKGKHNYSVDFNIKNPKLWWCNGMGEAHLYNLEFRLIKDKSNIDIQKETIGIRSIELVQEDDDIGKSFFFRLNGKDVFIKGANFVPADNFLPRVSKATYKALIDEAVWANFNMLRVWGGGIYESDDFYDLCDKNGIMVWQDFMFACNMYPGDSAFMKNVENEAKDNIIRLRNHASLALWCGNNEVDNGWKDWGWQKQFGYSKEDSIELWSNYLALFENLLPNLVAKYDEQHNYHPSSPTYGWGHDENFTHGDSHYWGVWWGHEPFEVFNTKVGRFMSEYGFQSIPNIRSIKEYTSKQELSLSSPSMATHQKHPTGYETIDEYLQRDYKTTYDFKDYIYLSQLTQAEGITKAIEAHRRNKPHCMGTLYWQFNDAWPVSSWSSIDYYGRRKALHYFVKEAYKPIIISCEERNDSLYVYAISEIEPPQSLKLNIMHYGFDNTILFYDSIKFIVSKAQNTMVYKFSNDIKSSESFLYFELINGTASLDEEFYYFQKPKEIPLRKVGFDINIEKKDSIYIINLQANALAKNVEIITNLEGKLSENYFDMLPNKSKKIAFIPSEKGSLTINIKTLNNLYR